VPFTAHLNCDRIACKTFPLHRRREDNAVFYGSAGIENFAQSDSLAANPPLTTAACPVEVIKMNPRPGSAWPPSIGPPSTLRGLQSFCGLLLTLRSRVFLDCPTTNPIPLALAHLARCATAILARPQPRTEPCLRETLPAWFRLPCDRCGHTTAQPAPWTRITDVPARGALS
jgi:hypothetical protein